MREIKFRVWDGNQWYYFKIGQSFGAWGLSVYDYHCLQGRQFYQYTGLKDKNGKEIYEGDIVETPSVKKMVIDWSEKFASFVINREGWAFQHFFGEAMNPQDCTVIGNIHENPELLKP